jgi:orotate phosphoribosyltransferase
VLAEAREQGTFDSATMREVEVFLKSPEVWQEGHTT